MHCCWNHARDTLTHFVHVNACQVVSEYLMSPIWGTCHQLLDLVGLPAPDNHHVDSVVQVFYHFAERRVVHQLVEVCFKVALRPIPELCVHPYVRLHPWLLVELEDSVNCFQVHVFFEIKLQVPVMDCVLFLAFRKVQPQTILFHSDFLEFFKQVCQQDHICLDIKVVVVGILQKMQFLLSGPLGFFSLLGAMNPSWCCNNMFCDFDRNTCLCWIHMPQMCLWSLPLQGFLTANVTFLRGVELYPVLFCHYDRLWS